MASTIKAYKCPECSAPLKVAPEDTQARCQFCGHSFAVQHTRKRPPPTQTHTVWAPPPVSRWLFVLPFLFTMTIVGVSLWRAGVVGMVSSLATSGAGPGSGGFSPLGERLQWDPLEPIAIAAVDDDGMEDVIGRYRTLDGSDLNLWVGAFAGGDFHRLWKAGPFGNLTTAMQAVHVAVAGDRVLVTDGRNTARLFELHTGKPAGVVSLSDRAEAVCAHEGQLFVQTVDGKGVLIDARSGTGTEKKRPAWCRKKSGIGDDCWSMQVHLHSECKGPHAAPSHAGFRARWVLRDGGRAVAVGGKHPGTHLPMLMGFDAEARRVDWVRPLGADATLVADGDPELTELQGGRVFSYYSLKAHGGRVAMLDAKTGAVGWDVVLPRSESGSGPSELVVTGRRVYIPHWTWLDVLDAQSGAHLGTIGRW